MVIALAIGASVLATALHTLHTLMNVQDTATRTFAESATTWRIGELFRRDVHAAETAELGKVEDGTEARQLRLLQSAGRAVRWDWDDGALTRRTLRGGEPVQTERFRLPRAADVAFAADGEFAILTITWPPGRYGRGRQPDETAPRRTVRIEALRGRDARLFGTRTE